ncbi:hypothetical protein QAD02_014263 [Eretmocerus hayati]|uniref:Uncharacterized protein n=1 Tax=Eretmocerus hayati TaxID=131215 RepID=A0ACC2P6I1_9HYME|nr:hypothetical protein QAD02_014263 [Eretmocerus hayati]
MAQHRRLRNRTIEAEEPEIDVVTIDNHPVLDACEQATREIEETAMLATKEANDWAADVHMLPGKSAYTTTSNASAIANIETRGKNTNQAHACIADAQPTSATGTNDIFVAADAEAAGKITRQTKIWADVFRTSQHQPPLAKVNSNKQSAAFAEENTATPSPIGPRLEETRNEEIIKKKNITILEKEMRSVPANTDADTWQTELKAAEELAQRGYASKLLFLLQEKLQKEQEVGIAAEASGINQETSAMIGKIRSAPRKFDAGDWREELEAAKELARQGLASNLLVLLKEKLQQNQDAANRVQSSEYVPIPIGTPQQNQGTRSYARTSGIMEYVPTPIGTAPIPSMPKGIPIRAYLYPSTTAPAAPGNAIPLLALPRPTMMMDQYKPLDSTSVPTNSLVTATAPMEFGAKTTSTYTRPLTATGIKRRYDTMSGPAVATATEATTYNTINGRQLYSSEESGTRSLFAASLIRREQCVGPALGVPVGKIPVNPLMAPENELQGKLFEAIMTGKYKIGLLKTTDGKIIMRKKGAVVLQPDRQGWRCGACVLKFPKKYNNWKGWVVHEVHQVGVSDEFLGNFLMLCVDCGRCPLRTENLDDCPDAITVCARHWGDIDNGIIMEVIPIRVDCRCSQQSAGNLQNRNHQTG